MPAFQFRDTKYPRLILKPHKSCIGTGPGIVAHLGIALHDKLVSTFQELYGIEIRCKETSPPDCWNSILRVCKISYQRKNEEQLHIGSLVALRCKR